ncbi:MAG: hypothetical protein RL319_992, partial [Actinomycetota bacterium]
GAAACAGDFVDVPLAGRAQVHDRAPK